MKKLYFILSFSFVFCGQSKTVDIKKALQFLIISYKPDINLTDECPVLLKAEKPKFVKREKRPKTKFQKNRKLYPSQDRRS